MAINLHTGSRSKRRRMRPNAEMNLTPLIDVMVVLLIIFMISAPLMTVTVPVDLPEVGKGSSSDAEEPLVISIDKDNNIYLQDTKLQLTELIPKLQAVTGQKPDQRIFIRADQSLTYGTMMKIMSEMTAAGFTKVSLVAETGS
jgi:biopolymer transport protein TolR